MLLYSGGDTAKITLAGVAVEVKVGAARMVGRKVVSIFNLSGATIYRAWNSSKANGTDGFPILTNTGVHIMVDDQTQVWISGTGDVRIEEAK
jgi:hypothetical protein